MEKPSEQPIKVEARQQAAQPLSLVQLSSLVSPPPPPNTILPFPELSTLDEEIEFALKLDFDRRPILTRHGEGEIILNPSLMQPNEQHR